MLYFKQICLVIYLIITVLFTVGYATLPLLTNNVADISNIGKDITTITKSNNNVSSYNKALLQFVFYSCISITVLLCIGILLGFIDIKFISKIVF